MVAYSFKRRFVTPIRVGLGLIGMTHEGQEVPVEFVIDDKTGKAAPFDPLTDLDPPVHPKRQTIRGIGKRRHARPGENLQLYCGMRTKGCFQIGTARCVSVQDVRIHVHSMVTVGGGDAEGSLREKQARRSGPGGKHHRRHEARGAQEREASRMKRMGGMKDLFGDEPVTYPDRPGHVRGSDTSEAAARSMDGPSGELRRRVLANIVEVGNATCDEVEVALDLSHQTASARIRELCFAGFVEDTGERRNTRSGRKARIYSAVRR